MFSTIQAQNSADSVYHVQIAIKGLHKTKENTIIRDFPHNLQQPISKANIEITRHLLRQITINSKLFTAVECHYRLSRDTVYYQIDVREKWYSYPLPYLYLGDRNFNEWWVYRGHALNRWAYGFHINQLNLTGRKDNLQVNLITGFEKNLGVRYDRPFISFKKRIGLHINASYILRKNLAYGASDNILLYTKGEKDLFKRQLYELGLWHKPDAFRSHFVMASLSDASIDDTIATLNTRYFGNGAKRQQYFSLGYTFSLDKRNLKSYATKGYLLELEAIEYVFKEKDTPPLSTVKLKYAQHLAFSDKWSLASSSQIKVSTPAAQPYNLQKGLGWDNELIRAYGYHVIDGQQYFLQKFSLRFKAFEKNIETGIKKYNQFIIIPMACYPKLFFDVGYVSDRYYKDFGTLQNHWLWGGGAGIDILSFNENVIRIEFAVNQTGFSSIYLNWITDIQ